MNSHIITMENIHNLKDCGWVTEEPIKLREYFNEYHVLLDNVFYHPHEEKIHPYTAIRNFFPPMNSEEDNKEDSFNVQKLEENCSINMLTVEDELAVQDVLDGPVRHSGRLTNWYAGSFQDGIIPAGAADTLATLQAQTEELYLRNTVRDYARLRNRLLKYFSTVRMIIREDNSPEPTRCDKDNANNECMRDIILNVRVQRPYHKKTHMKKACNRFPTHSQELLLLGSQKLSDLRDALICINDLGINQDLSPEPQFYQMSHLRNNSAEFPSGFFYINGVFYDDIRDPNAKIYSEGIRKWAKKSPEIGELQSKNMHETIFLDLELRLGYPYVFLHQGNCEHIIIFTDVRLHHRHDVQDPARYPLLRGQASKLSVKCFICSLHLANWIVMDEPQFPIPNAHVCDRCLKIFCYDSHGMKTSNIKVYPFIDEFMVQQKKIIDNAKFLKGQI